MMNTSMQAIKNNGIDYVLKPFKEEEIHKALQQYKRLIKNIQSKQRSASLIFILSKAKPYPTELFNSIPRKVNRETSRRGGFVLV